jgi:hypothetical protein
MGILCLCCNYSEIKPAAIGLWHIISYFMQFHELLFWIGQYEAQFKDPAVMICTHNDGSDLFLKHKLMYFTMRT